MGEVCEIFDVKPSLIRFWEQKFSILKPHKNKKGNRLFTPQDLENLKLIYHLVKEKGMTLQGAQIAMKSQKQTLKQDVSIVEKMQEIKALLEQLNQVLDDNSQDSEVSQQSIKPQEIIILQTPDIETKQEIETAPAFIQQSLF